MQVLGSRIGKGPLAVPCSAEAFRNHCYRLSGTGHLHDECKHAHAESLQLHILDFQEGNYDRKEF